MLSGLGIVRIPNRFEPLRDVVGANRLAQVLIEPDGDLTAVKKSIAELRTTGQGKLLFLLGSTGQGKTSLASSLPIFLSGQISETITPPAEFSLPLVQLAAWIQNELAKRANADKRVVVVNLDSRETPTTNEAETQTAMVSLNALLRKHPQLLLVWPIVDDSFASKAIERLRKAGGQTALASNPIYQVAGLPKSKYFDALKLILTATSVTLLDAAVSEDEARGLVEKATNLGDYLNHVKDLVVSRYDLGDLETKLPKITVCLSSSKDTNEVCRQLRRGSGFYADPDRILQFSRSNASDDWKTLAKENARKSFPFISSLFELKIVSIGASAVVNACAFCEDPQLKEMVRTHYPNPVSSNAANSLAGTSLARNLKGEPDGSAAGSQPSSQILSAFKAIQGASKSKHKAINTAICSVLARIPGISLPGLEFEKQLVQGRGLQVDVLFKRADRPETIEFTHRDEDHSSVSVLSSYILEKTRDYARDYGLL